MGLVLRRNFRLTRLLLDLDSGQEGEDKGEDEGEDEEEDEGEAEEEDEGEAGRVKEKRMRRRRRECGWGEENAAKEKLESGEMESEKGSGLLVDEAELRQGGFCAGGSNRKIVCDLDAGARHRSHAGAATNETSSDAAFANVGGGACADAQMEAVTEAKACAHVAAGVCHTTLPRGRTSLGGGYMATSSRSQSLVRVADVPRDALNDAAHAWHEPKEGQTDRLRRSKRTDRRRQGGGADAASGSRGLPRRARELCVEKAQPGCDSGSACQLPGEKGPNTREASCSEDGPVSTPEADFGINASDFEPAQKVDTDGSDGGGVEVASERLHSGRSADGRGRGQRGSSDAAVDLTRVCCHRVLAQLLQWGVAHEWELEHGSLARNPHHPLELARAASATAESTAVEAEALRRVVGPALESPSPSSSPSASASASVSASASASASAPQLDTTMFEANSSADDVETRSDATSPPTSLHFDLRAMILGSPSRRVQTASPLLLAACRGQTSLVSAIQDVCFDKQRDTCPGNQSDTRFDSATCLDSSLTNSTTGAATTPPNTANRANNAIVADEFVDEATHAADADATTAILPNSSLPLAEDALDDRTLCMPPLSHERSQRSRDGTDDRLDTSAAIAPHIVTGAVLLCHHALLTAQLTVTNTVTESPPLVWPSTRLKLVPSTCLKLVPKSLILQLYLLPSLSTRLAHLPVCTRTLLLLSIPKPSTHLSHEVDYFRQPLPTAPGHPTLPHPFLSRASQSFRLTA
eukprot:3079980-Pleurochrysis_carterae.AAC.2